VYQLKGQYHIQLKRKLLKRKSILILFILLLSSCDPHTDTINIAKYPDKLVYISGVDTELDFSGGVLHITMPHHDRAMDEFLTDYYMESYIDFSSVGVEVILIKAPGQEIEDTNRFPIQIIDQAFIDKIVKCKTEGICE